MRFLLVLAFVSHVHHLTGTACTLLNGGDYASAVPLLRVAYGSALTAAWAAESEDAARALQNHYVGGVEKLRADEQKTGWFDELLESLPEPEIAADVAPRARGEAGSFFNLCRALEPHPDWLYTAFRLLSAYAHSSGSVVRTFVPSTADQRAHFPGGGIPGGLPAVVARCRNRPAACRPGIRPARPSSAAPRASISCRRVARMGGTAAVDRSCTTGHVGSEGGPPPPGALSRHHTWASLTLGSPKRSRQSAGGSPIWSGSACPRGHT